MVRDKFISQKGDYLNFVERRLGQSSCCRNNPTYDLRGYKSRVCWDSAVCVKTFRPLRSINIVC
jgi:hypothetical protein